MWSNWNSYIVGTKTAWQLHTKFNTHLPYSPMISLPAICLRQRKIYVQRFVRECSQQFYQNSQKAETNQMSTNREINQSLCTRTVERYTNIFKKEPPITATTWLTLQRMWINEISQKQSTYYRIPFL